MRLVKLALLVTALTIGCGREVPATAGDRTPVTEQPVIAPSPRKPGATAKPSEVSAWTLTRVSGVPCQTEPHLGAAGDRVFFGCDGTLYALGDDQLEAIAGLPGSSQPPHRSINDIAVSATGDVWVVASEPAEGSNTTVNRIYRLAEQALVPIGEALVGGGPAMLFPWDDESVLAVMADPPGQVRLAIVGHSERPQRALPELTPAVPTHPFCEVSIRGFETALALAAGQVLLVAGQVCGVDDGSGASSVVNRGFGVERLHRSAPRGKLELVDVEQLALATAMGASSDRGADSDATATAADSPWLWAVDAAVAKRPDSIVIAVHGFGGPDGAAPPAWMLSTRGGGDWVVQSPPTATGLERLWVDRAGAIWGRDRGGQLWFESGVGWMRVRPSLGAEELVAELAFTRQSAWLLSRSASAPNEIQVYRGAPGPVLVDRTVAAPPTAATDQ